MASSNLHSSFFAGLSHLGSYNVTGSSGVHGPLGAGAPREELQLLARDEGSHISTGQSVFNHTMYLRANPSIQRLDLSLDQSKELGGHGSGNRFSDETNFLSSFPSGLSGVDRGFYLPPILPCDEGRSYTGFLEGSGLRLSLHQGGHGSQNLVDNVAKPVSNGQPTQQPAPSAQPGRATDPHSFADPVHDKAEQNRARQQELVPTLNKKSTEDNNELREPCVGKKRTTTEKSNFETPPKPRKRQARRAEVWQHFTQKEDDKAFSNCRYCSQEIGCDSKKNGTTAMKNHIARCKAYQEKDNQKLLLRKKNSQKVLCSDEEHYCDLFTRSVIEMIVLDELPFEFVESEGFRRFCTNMLPRHTVHRKKEAIGVVLDMFQRKKASLKNLFSSEKPRVSLTMDIWVAPTTCYKYMMITAHWINENWDMQKRIISFKPVTDQKEETIAKHLTSCLKEWGIEKVFTVTMDYEKENDKGLRLFRDAWRQMGPEALVKDGEFLHMCCCAHILNLIVRDGLTKVNESIVAIKNAVKYVQSSDERLKSFELMIESEKFSNGSLTVDCGTSWKSTYLMLTAALKFRVPFEKLAGDNLYNEYFMESENGLKRVGPPTANNWDEVQRLVKLLKIFFNGTLALSASKTVTSTISYNEIVIIEKNLVSLSHNNDPSLRMEAEAMKTTFKNYWDGLMDPLVIIASVFDPRNKMQFASICFDKLYGSEQSAHLKSSIMKLMKELFEEYVIKLNKSSQGDTVRTMSDNEESERENDLSDDDGYERRDSLYAKMVPDSSNEKDELDIYLLEKLVPRNRNNLTSDYDVLSWWRSNSHKYPILSELARDVLAIQVSSVASESAFSTIGRTLDPYRSSLTPDLIEALICTQQWLKKNTKKPC